MTPELEEALQQAKTHLTIPFEPKIALHWIEKAVELLAVQPPNTGVEEIEKRIAKEYTPLIEVRQNVTAVNPNYKAAMFGYSLAQEEIERLKGLINEILGVAHKQAPCKTCIDMINNFKTENNL